MNAAAALPAHPFPMRFTHDDAVACLPAVAPLLKRACDHSGGRFAPEHIMHGLQEGFFQLWGVARDRDLLCVCVTMLHTYPTGLKTVEIILLGGDQKEALYPFLKTLATFGADNGCERVEFFGRRGFERDLPEARATARLYEVDI